MPEYRCKVLEIEGARNIRDIGGYPGRGGSLRYGRFLRGGSLSGLTGKGVGQLLEAGVDCIVDLRSVFERARWPNVVGEAQGVAEAHIPMMDFIRSEAAQGSSWFPESLEAIYLETLEKGGSGFRRVFEVLARDYNCVLFHCTAGKDRTGMTAMLLMALAGVDEDIIAEDYSYSYSLNREEHIPGVPEYLLYSNESTIRLAMATLRERYGGMLRYLEEIGVTRELREAVCNRLGVIPV